MPSKQIEVTELGPVKNINVSVDDSFAVDVTVEGSPVRRIEISGTPGVQGKEGPPGAGGDEIDIVDLTTLFENGLI